MICEGCVHEGWIDLQDKREHHCRLYHCMVSPYARSCKDRTIRIDVPDANVYLPPSWQAQEKTDTSVEKKNNPYDGYPADGRTADQVIRDVLADNQADSPKRKRGRPRGWGMKVK